MSTSGSVQRGLVWLAMLLVAVALVAGVTIGTALDGPVRRDVLAGLAVVLASMLIGLVPLRIFLRAGPENIVAGWIAAMILRVLACLVGLVVLLKKYQLSPATCVWTICGSYLVLLAVETIGLNRLMRNAFDRQFKTEGN